MKELKVGDRVFVYSANDFGTMCKKATVTYIASPYFMQVSLNKEKCEPPNAVERKDWVHRYQIRKIKPKKDTLFLLMGSAIEDIKTGSAIEICVQNGWVRAARFKVHKP